MGSPSPLQFYILPHICELYKRFSPFSEKSAFCIRRRLAERCFRAFCCWGVSIWSPTRPAVAIPSGGACLLCRLLPPAFSLLSCPLSPQPPSPAGKGETISLFRRGLCPRHPCTEPLAALTDLAKQAPAGGLPALSPVAPAFSLRSCPLSPRPLPRRGRGRPKVYFAGGFAPGTPALNRLQHLQSLPLLYPAEACPVGCRLTLPPLYPAGGVSALPPPYPAISFTFCPLSPQPPSPAGKGETKSLFRRGLRPRHPCAEPLAALTEPSSAVPGGGACPAGCRLDLPPLCPAGGLNPSGTCSTCPGGEDHLKRRSSSPPVPPLLGCRHCSKENASCRFCGEP